MATEMHDDFEFPTYTTEAERQNAADHAAEQAALLRQAAAIAHSNPNALVFNPSKAAKGGSCLSYVRNVTR